MKQKDALNRLSFSSEILISCEISANSIYAGVNNTLTHLRGKHGALD